MIHSILLIGQSNAGGRGFVQEAPPIDSENILVLRNGRWRKAYRPVNPDRVTSGVCFAESFASLYRDNHPDVEVGIIPCADGGTQLLQWQKGSLLYDHAVNCARLAQRTSHIVAVLWHQGESDCLDERVPLFKDRLSDIIDGFRADLGLEDVPFIIGGLGDFLIDFKGGDSVQSRNYLTINGYMQQVAQEKHRCGFVSAAGLRANADNIHFSAVSLLEFGKRYYSVFETLEDKTRVFCEKTTMDAAIRGELESL